MYRMKKFASNLVKKEEKKKTKENENENGKEKECEKTNSAKNSHYLLKGNEYR